MSSALLCSEGLEPVPKSIIFNTIMEQGIAYSGNISLNIYQTLILGSVLGHPPPHVPPPLPPPLPPPTHTREPMKRTTFAFSSYRVEWQCPNYSTLGGAESIVTFIE